MNLSRVGKNSINFIGSSRILNLRTLRSLQIARPYFCVPRSKFVFARNFSEFHGIDSLNTDSYTNGDYLRSFECWWSVMEVLASTSKRLEKEEIVRRHFSLIFDQPELIGQFLRLSLPDSYNIVYNLRDKRIINFVCLIINIDSKELEDRIAFSGDISVGLPQFLLERAHIEENPLRLREKSSLSMKEVLDVLAHLSSLSKHEEFIEFLKDFIPRCSSQDLKWFLRIISGIMRTGAKEPLFMKALGPSALDAYRANGIAYVTDTYRTYELGQSLLEPKQAPLEEKTQEESPEEPVGVKGKGRPKKKPKSEKPAPKPKVKRAVNLHTGYVAPGLCVAVKTVEQAFEKASASLTSLDSSLREHLADFNKVVSLLGLPGAALPAYDLPTCAESSSDFRKENVESKLSELSNSSESSATSRRWIPSNVLLEVFRRLGAPISASASGEERCLLAEIKYDGFRCILRARAAASGPSSPLHCTFKSRAGKEIREQISDNARRHIALFLSPTSLPCVLDGELMLLGPDELARPFTEIGTERENRQSEDSQVSYVVFDVLSVAGEPVLQWPLLLRRLLLLELQARAAEALDAVAHSSISSSSHADPCPHSVSRDFFSAPDDTNNGHTDWEPENTPNRELEAPGPQLQARPVLVSRGRLCMTLEALQETVSESVSTGDEGVIAKNLAGPYEPGLRRWIKLKQDHLREQWVLQDTRPEVEKEDSSLMDLNDGDSVNSHQRTLRHIVTADSVDLVVLGSYLGTGRYASQQNVWLCGVPHPDGSWRTVVKVGNGMNDEDALRFSREYDMVRVHGREDIPQWLHVHNNLIPDFVIRDPWKAPVWEVLGSEFSKSKTHSADFISIRFPRLLRERTDKGPKDATSLDQLRYLYSISNEKDHEVA